MFSLHRNAGSFLWILVGVAVTGKILIKGGDRSVYPIFATASEHWWAGISMYQYTEGDVFRYSPAFAIFFTPFSLDEMLGHVLWVLAGMGVLYYACRQLHATLLAPDLDDAGEQTLNLYLLLVAITFVRSVWQAQSNILLIAFVILGIVALRRGRDWRASAFLTSTVFIKLWPVALIILLSVGRPALLLRCAVVGVVLAVMPFLTQPPGVVVDQYQFWMTSLMEDQVRRTSYRDLWTMWELLPGTEPNVAIYRILELLGAFVVFAMVLVLGRQDRTENQRLFLVLSLWVCWQLQLGPGTERMTFSIFAPIIAFALVAYRDHRRWLLLTSYVLLAVFTHGSLERVFEGILPGARMMIVLAATTYFGWVVWQLMDPTSPGSRVDWRRMTQDP